MRLLRRIFPFGPRAARRWYFVGFGIALAAATMLVWGAVLVVWGFYDVSAVQQHTAPVFHTLDTALKSSISRRAANIEPPPLEDPAMLERGSRIFQAKCVQCHGAPGVGRDDLGKGMTPLPANLVHTARTWTAAEIFWTVKHGVKMTGMPAWAYKYTDEEIWSVVAFIRQLPRYSPVDYRELVRRMGPLREETTPEPATLPPDPKRGQLALREYACTVCHRVPGVVGPEAEVGPPLAGIAERRYIAGVLPNTFDNMVRWLRDPKAVDPLTAMPAMGLKEQDAVDIAAYLATLE